MRRKRSDLDEADALLSEWGAGFTDSERYGYPPSPVSPTVQGGKPWLSSAEEYANDAGRWSRIDSAVAAVGDEWAFGSIILRERYRLGRSERRIADSYALDLAEFHPRMEVAMGMFLEEYRARKKMRESA